MTRHWKTVQRALALAEAVIPCDADFLRFVEGQRPDLVLVTPLVEFGSYQTEYVKCGHRLGVPVLYLPFSWDNLTNRGLIRVAPDRTLVWNVHQQREAVDFHGVAPEAIVVTGAPRFDEFFEMRPASEPRRLLRLPGARPLAASAVVPVLVRLRGPTRTRVRSRVGRRDPARRARHLAGALFDSGAAAPGVSRGVEHGWPVGSSRAWPCGRRSRR